ncbi:MAG: ATP-dependent sacrificial sulfur transferase LarE [Deltaproteobacteria bacterium]|nr:ATP-dependent sacrificial sulfur transferase LarE [Deltaproteobacteria bacterium]
MNLDKSVTKKECLVNALKQYESLAVAFSGGVDSTFLLAVAHDVLKKKVIALTADSPVHPPQERAHAVELAKSFGVEHIVIKSREMDNIDFVANRKNRCYVCKKLLFEDILNLAMERGIRLVAHGANVDDLRDFRPGFKAAEEMGIVSPMVDAGLTKEDIRRLSKEMNLPTWDKPSMACLATRIPYGTPISLDALEMVDKAENFITCLGFMTCRVRHHGKVARIELSHRDFNKIMNEEIRDNVILALRKIGFSHIAVDMEGYIQGSMNRSENCDLLRG